MSYQSVGVKCGSGGAGGFVVRVTVISVWDKEREHNDQHSISSSFVVSSWPLTHPSW